MSSRYDHPDAGAGLDDNRYDEPAIDAADEPIEEGPDSPPVCEDWRQSVDPVAHAIHTALSAIADLQAKVGQQPDFDSRMRFLRLVQQVEACATQLVVRSLEAL